MMTTLPAPLVDYFEATNAHDVAAMLARFAESSVVQDEGHRHRGLAAIRAWMSETIEKYDFRVAPVESARHGRKTIVLVTVSGRFPGSPATLQYQFTVTGQKIARLEIG